MALAEIPVDVDFIGSDSLDTPELRGNEHVRFLNLRGDQSMKASFVRKAVRIGQYYMRLIGYTLSSRPRVFHILWNNKFEYFDRTLLMIAYRLCRKRVVLTAHNVNSAARDGRDNWLNRMTLAVQYRLTDHIFVHTAKMKAELLASFRVPAKKVSVIPFGINNTAPRTDISSEKARDRLGLGRSRRVALFFGQIAPYKGLQYLVAAATELLRQDPDFVLLIAGRVKKGAEQYWRDLEKKMPHADGRVILEISHIPDASVELYFKAADVLVLPYAEIFQSGVPFLSYSFGLPVIATDVGSLREDVIDGETGLICRPFDPLAIKESMQTYFASELYRNLGTRRARIAEFANEKYSWSRVAEITSAVYRELATHS